MLKVKIGDKRIKVIDIEEKPNYIVVKLREKPRDTKTYRRKIIKTKDGRERILNVAIRKNGKTVVTSIWYPKDDPKAKYLKQLAKEKGILRKSKTVKKEERKKKSNKKTKRR